MNLESSPPGSARPSWLRNWLSLSGLVLMTGSLFSFLLLFVIDAMAHVNNPYLGVLTYLVAPAFTTFGLGLTVFGALRQRWRGRQAGLVPSLVIDFSRPRDRRYLVVFVLGSIGFLLVAAMGSYGTYHFTESAQFCGSTCHEVMKPERVTYQHGPHARVSCTECHIGSGATWFVRSKLSGTYQVYATLANKFPRPVPTPVKNLRPAQDTCEQCHWPRGFVGNLERTFTSFLSDQTNPVYSVRMLLKVGGADPTRGPVGGIHWHMSVANKVEYLATDEARQKIPWVRLTDSKGTVSEFRSPGFTNTVDEAAVRRMDCIDCHNRPAHCYTAPNEAVNLAMSLGQIDTTLPFIKTNAVFALVKPYRTEAEAVEGIATTLNGKYPAEPRIEPAIKVVQQIYRDNFFPEMNANWRKYPENIGHKNWLGCFRCHDDKHKTVDGKKAIVFTQCNTCHVILAQGSGAELENLSAKGQTFKHPGDEYDPAYLCSDCHTGGP